MSLPGAILPRVRTLSPVCVWRRTPKLSSTPSQCGATISAARANVVGSFALNCTMSGRSCEQVRKCARRYSTSDTKRSDSSICVYTSGEPEKDDRGRRDDPSAKCAWFGLHCSGEVVHSRSSDLSTCVRGVRRLLVLSVLTVSPDEHPPHDVGLSDHRRADVTRRTNTLPAADERRRRRVASGGTHVGTSSGMSPAAKQGHRQKSSASEQDTLWLRPLSLFRSPCAFTRSVRLSPSGPALLLVRRW